MFSSQASRDAIFSKVVFLCWSGVLQRPGPLHLYFIFAMWYVNDEDAGIEESFGYREHHKIIEWEANVKELTEKPNFALKCKDKSRGLSLFGTVPPPKKISMDQVC